MKYFFALFFSCVSCTVFAHRIITLAPNLTEIVFAAGAGKQLVGVSSFSDYPRAAKKLPIIATDQNVDLERVERLQPDIIVAWTYTNTLILEQLKRLHIPLYQFSFDQLSDIPNAIETVGRLAGTPQRAKKAAQKFVHQLSRLQKTYAHKKHVTVFYQLSQHPLMTLNRHSLVDQVIQLCGGKNIFENTLGLAPTVSIENILQKNPQVILIASSGNHSDDLKFWQAYPQLQAVQNHHLYSINPSLIERYGPRLWQGADIICRGIDNARD